VGANEGLVKLTKKERAIVMEAAERIGADGWAYFRLENLNRVLMGEK
jgi:hypothetical protein